jgi:hypothetical protein
MTYVPFLTGRNFHLAKMADAIMSEKYVGPHFSRDAHSFHWIKDSSASSSAVS